MKDKWTVFKDESRRPKWIVRDEYGEFQFRTGREALEFVDCELRKRKWAQEIQWRQEKISGELD